MTSRLLDKTTLAQRGAWDWTDPCPPFGEHRKTNPQLKQFFLRCPIWRMHPNPTQTWTTSSTVELQQIVITGIPLPFAASAVLALGLSREPPRSLPDRTHPEHALPATPLFVTRTAGKPDCVIGGRTYPFLAKQSVDLRHVAGRLTTRKRGKPVISCTTHTRTLWLLMNTNTWPVNPKGKKSRGNAYTNNETRTWWHSHAVHGYEKGPRAALSPGDEEYRRSVHLSGITAHNYPTPMYTLPYCGLASRAFHFDFSNRSMMYSLHLFFWNPPSDTVGAKSWSTSILTGSIWTKTKRTLGWWWTLR